jgi:hypothetical protein
VKRIFSLASITLVLCSYTTTPAVVKDVHMGSDIAYGPEVMAYFGIFESLYARPFYSTKSEYGFKTRYTSPDKSWIVEAWSYGKQFEYHKGMTGKTSCFVQPCIPLIWETGLVTMDELDFRTAASNGFEFELAGKAGKVTGKIPAQAFSRGLEPQEQTWPHPLPPRL